MQPTIRQLQCGFYIAWHDIGLPLMQIWTEHRGKKAKLTIPADADFTGTNLALAHGLEPTTLCLETGDRFVPLGEGTFHKHTVAEKVRTGVAM